MIKIVLLLHSNVIEYFHCAIDPDYRDLQPNTFLISEGLKWGQMNKKRYWNWQSTKKKNSSVHQFKLSWGSEESKHFYFTKVLRNCDHIFEEGSDTVKQRYPFYYILPHGAYENQCWR